MSSELIADLRRAAIDHLRDYQRRGQEARGFLPRGHRGLLAMVKAAVVCEQLVTVGEAQGPGSDQSEAESRAADASRWLSELQALQMDTGLFASGDNLASPPDTAFTITDAALTLGFAADSPWPHDLLERLRDVVARALPALISGGVHTPNHRWEIAAALALGARVLGPARLGEGVHDAALDRARQWLAEGVDIDADGIYSERSPNYAAYVSNPSLLALADALERDELAALAHQNLHTQLDLTTPSGLVEAVHSRRQDQGRSDFPLGPFLGQFAHFATSCDRCAAGMALAATTAEIDHIDVLAHAGIDTAVMRGLQVRARPELASVRRTFDAVGLLRRSGDGHWCTIYGGSDVPRVGRIASGLACNPTFLRLGLGDVQISSVRLSRDFFAMGPFRASSFEATDDGARLSESLSTGYYQPLRESLRDAAGEYPMEYEGRFAAAMRFSERELDEMSLRTQIEVRASDDAVDLAIVTEGTAVPHALELGLGHGTEVVGARQVGAEAFVLDEGTATLRHGDTEVRVGPGLGAQPGLVPEYHPGEAYAFMGGTDAVGGPRLYLTWFAPRQVQIQIARA